MDEESRTSPYPLCEHIRPGGERCGSPALKDGTLCYYHSGVRQRIPRVNMMVFLANPRSETDPHFQYEMPYLEDPESIQMAFTQLIHVVTQERIRVDRARIVLSALHGASLNLRGMEKARERREKPATAKKPAGSVKAVAGSRGTREEVRKA